MKKNYSFKALCLITGLMMGAVSTWAQSKTLLEYGTVDAPWTDATLAEWTATGTASIVNNEIASLSGGNGSNAATKTISPNAKSIINVEAVWRATSGLGRYFTDGNGSYFRFGNIVVAQNDQNKLHGYVFSGIDNLASATTFTVKDSYRTDIANMPFLLIEIEVNTATNTLSKFAVKSEDGATTYASAENVPLENVDYTTIEFGFKKSKSAQNNSEQLKWIVVSETEQTIKTADYTVKFVDDNDNELKESIVRTGVVGDPITLTPDDTKNFYINDKKYIYDLDDAGSWTIDEGVEVRVLFREAYTWDWAINGIARTLVDEEPVYDENNDQTGTKPIYDEADLGQIKFGTAFEGDNATEGYPKAINVEGQWYESTTGKSFYSLELTEGAPEGTVYFTASDRIDYFFEVEDLTVENKRDDGYVPERAANRTSVRVGPSGYLYTPALKKGIYTMTVNANNSNSSDAVMSVELRDDEGTVTDTKLSLVRPQTGSYVETTVEGIAVPADGMMIQLANNSTYNCNLSVDYIILKKSGDAEFADYAIEFKDNAEGDSIIKTEIVKNVAVGAKIELDESYKQSFYSEDQSVKFVYESDDAAGKTVTKEGTVVTINFKYAENYDYTITAVNAENDIIALIGSGSIFEGDTKDVAFSMYVEGDNGQWYYREQPYVTVNEENKDMLVTFEPADITFFFECEDMNKTRRAATEDSGNNYSNGKAAGMAESSTWYTDAMETGGVYDLKVVGKSRRSGSTNIAVGFRTPNGNFVSSGDTLRWANNDKEDIVLEAKDITVPAECSLALVQYDEWNSVTYLDYIVMKKTADADYVGVTAPKGVSESTPADGTATGRMFNLRGQRVSTPQKGIYILNGKKLFVR